MFSSCLFVCGSSVHLFIYHHTWQHDILKMNQPIVMPIGTSGLRGKGMKRSTLRSGGQSSRSHKAKDRFGGLVQTSISTAWVK